MRCSLQGPVCCVQGGTELELPQRSSLLALTGTLAVQQRQDKLQLKEEGCPGRAGPRLPHSCPALQGGLCPRSLPSALCPEPTFSSGEADPSVTGLVPRSYRLEPVPGSREEYGGTPALVAQEGRTKRWLREAARPPSGPGSAPTLSNVGRHGPRSPSTSRTRQGPSERYVLQNPPEAPT